MLCQFARAVCVPALAFAAIGLFAAEASASPSATAVAQTSGKLNLLRGAETRRPVRLGRAAAVGSGSYICSPAGFGKRSRCYKN
ncbi:hypothetical protein [Leisingera sp. ANG-Vp]|uniref:hypothetical protein n=1 Tax=Leisingera sp. ANG-Vp TaxID=1577896 RepID=UPI0005807A31|nr:hypothetical protein [Leisingera sp. ANG-Vp]KIC15192.1 hypothetical protein RA20_18735 [Leisingera sp. ANG-Vp]